MYGVGDIDEWLRKAQRKFPNIEILPIDSWSEAWQRITAITELDQWIRRYGELRRVLALARPWSLFRGQAKMELFDQQVKVSPKLLNRTIPSVNNLRDTQV